MYSATLCLKLPVVGCLPYTRIPGTRRPADGASRYQSIARVCPTKQFPVESAGVTMLEYPPASAPFWPIRQVSPSFTENWMEFALSPMVVVSTVSCMSAFGTPAATRASMTSRPCAFGLAASVALLTWSKNGRFCSAVPPATRAIAAGAELFGVEVSAGEAAADGDRVAVGPAVHPARASASVTPATSIAADTAMRPVRRTTGRVICLILGGCRWDSVGRRRQLSRRLPRNDFG